MEQLIKEYEHWIASKGYPLMSADELLMQTHSNNIGDDYIVGNKDDREYLKDFIKRFEVAASDDTECDHSNTHEKLDSEQCEDCGLELEVQQVRVFKIDGYWVDDKQEFQECLVSEFDDTPSGYKDEDIFYYGLNEAAIKDAIAEQKPVDDFVITGYEVLE